MSKEDFEDIVKIIAKGKRSYIEQTNPETSCYECFFHYTDEGIFCAGFQEGYELARKEFKNDG